MRPTLPAAGSHSGRTLGRRWGAPRHLLSVPTGPGAPPADHPGRRISMGGGATAHHRSQTMQEGGSRHGHDLESPPCRGDHVPAGECPGVPAGGVGRCEGWRWHQAGRCPPPGDRRLLPLTHLLTRPLDHKWMSKAQKTRFTQTAQSPHVLGDEARHGRQKEQPPKNPMPIQEAIDLITRTTHEWINYKLSRQL